MVFITPLWHAVINVFQILVRLAMETVFVYFQLCNNNNINTSNTFFVGSDFIAIQIEFDVGC